MKGLGLLMLPGASKEKGAPGESKGSAKDAYAKEAFAALKDDDEAGFVAALTSLVSACAKKEEPSAEPATEESDEEEGY